MRLRVNVVAGDGSHRSFEMHGSQLRIGRQAANDIVLEDPQRIISNNHAEIVRRDSDFMLIDRSTNGIVANGEPMATKSSRALSSGDELRIGTYVLRVDIQQTETPVGDLLATSGADTGGHDILNDLPNALKDLPADETPVASPGVELPASSAAPVDPLDALLNPQSSPDPAPPSQGTDSRDPSESVLEEAFVAPRSEPDPEAPVAPETPPSADPLMDDVPTWARGLGATGESEAAPKSERAPEANAANADPLAMLGDTSGVDVPAPQQDVSQPPDPLPQSLPDHRPDQLPPDPPAAGPPENLSTSEGSTGAAPPVSGTLGHLLSGLGLDQDTPLTPEAQRAIGEVLRILLDGLIDMNRARAEVKNQMRLVRTILAAENNNPIKASTNALDALDLLFVHPRRSFLDPVSAATDTVADLATHELAMLSAFRAAFDTVKERLAPDTLEQRVQETAGKGIGFGLLEKSKYWDAYKAYYRDNLADNDAFLQAFADAYDEAVTRLSRKG